MERRRIRGLRRELQITAERREAFLSELHIQPGTVSFIYRYIPSRLLHEVTLVKYV